MNGLRIEWIQASFFIEMLVITWILMIPMKKREHFWQQGVLLVLAGSVIAAMDTNSNIKFILETAMIGFIAYRVYVSHGERLLTRLSVLMPYSIWLIPLA